MRERNAGYDLCSFIDFSLSLLRPCDSSNGGERVGVGGKNVRLLGLNFKRLVFWVVIMKVTLSDKMEPACELCVTCVRILGLIDELSFFFFLFLLKRKYF